MSEKKEAEATNVSRRDVFNILSAAPAMAVVAGTALGQQHVGHVHGAAVATKTGGAYQRRTFDEHQWKTVCVLCDLIIPADEHSGSATQAGVPEFLDDWIAFRNEQDGGVEQEFKAEILGGLMWLDRESNRLFQKDFADASVDGQKQILDRVAYPKKVAKEDMAWAKFFSNFRSLTVSGFFSSKMGVADLPYLGNVAVMEWKGCDPKVWAIIEERMKNGYNGILEAKPWSSAS
jgi:hypothetical protein